MERQLCRSPHRHWEEGPVGVPTAWGLCLPDLALQSTAICTRILENPPCAYVYPIFYFILNFFPFLGPFCYFSTFLSPPK